MTPERWNRIKEVFNAALEWEEGEREAFLDGACAEDTDLRQEVERLLREHRETSGLKSPVKHQDLTGQTLSHYKILDKIGEGGMGVVYRAEDTKLHRTVALKFLRPDALQSQEWKTRFLHEAEAAAALDHPNICTVHEIDEDDGQTFLAMAFVDGESLSEKIQKRPLPLEETLGIATQVAEGLHAAHQKAIVHRDIKSANIMIDAEGRVKIMDFGLAHLAGGTRITKSGTVMGTPAYMSPEQVRGGEADHRTDIWSLGVVVYEMVSGRLPFRGESAKSVALAIQNEEPEPLMALRSGVPLALERIVVKALAKSAAERYPHIEDLLVDLRSVERGLESAPSRKAAPVWKRRSLVIWLGIAMAVVALVVMGWLLRRRQVPSQLVAGPLTADAGFEDTPTFSPDGTQVAYVWNGPKQDNFDIWVKLIGNESVLRLTNDPAADLSPEWSPDGRWIAFERPLSLNRGGVYLVSPIGGSEHKVGERSGLPRANYWASGGLSWHPDGNWLAICDAGSAGDACSLYVLSVETGEKRRLTSPPPGAHDTAPTFSPDGRTLAFARVFDWANPVSELFVLNLRDDLTPPGEPRRLTFRNQLSMFPAWTPDGRDIVFSSFPGTPELWRTPASGSVEPQPLMLVGEQGSAPSISRRGNRLAYARHLWDENIWRIEVAGLNRKAAGPVNLISSTANDRSCQYSPDGQNITFTSLRSGSYEVWVSGADGSNPRKLTSIGVAMTGAPRWSPDGRQIVFDSTASGNFDIYVMDASGGRPRRLTEEPSTEAVASWSKDGQHIYYMSDRTGRPEVWKMPASGGEATKVTRNGGYVAFESPDGKSVYFSKDFFGSSLWRVPASGGPEQRVLGPLLGFQFVLMDQGIYFEQPEPDGSASIRFLDFSTGRTDKIYTIERYSATGFSVSPDQRYILYGQLDLADSDLMLVENFR